MALPLDRRSIKDLLYCVEGLGRFESIGEDENNQQQKYVKGIDCIICVQDLQRFLRRDDEKRKISEQLGKWNVAKNHLLPLLKYHQEDPELAFEIVKLLVMMTLPANPKSSNLEDQLRTLQIHKENFVLPNPNVALTMALLVESLNKTDDDRTRRDIELIELVMALFKNLLAVPDPPVTNNAQNATRFQLQDDFIETLKRESVLRLYLVLAQNVEADNNRTMNVLLLETFYLLFRREDPQELVDTWYNFQKKAKGEKTTALGQKLAQMRENAAISRALSPAGSTVRHSRFGGSFVTQMEDASKKVHLTSVEKLAVRNATINHAAPTLRGRRPVIEKKPVSGLECKLTLKELADSVLQSCYNELMGSIRDDMIVGSDYLVESDFENFYWVMGFFTAYHATVFQARLSEWDTKTRKSGGSIRNSGTQKISFSPMTLLNDDDPGPKPVFDMSYLKATLDDNTFLFLADKIAQYKQEKSYARMGIATKALKELMSSLTAMYSSQESEENRRNAEIILLKLVYEPEAFLDRLVALVKVFTPAKMPLSSLSSAVECVHYLLKLLEANAKQLVQKKKRAGRAVADTGLEGDDEDDGAHLDHYEEDGLAPEGDAANPAADGAPGASADGSGAPKASEKAFSARQEAKQRDADEAAADREKYFDFQGYLAHFGKYSVVKNYVILLRNYARNGPRLNHVVVKYFHRLIHTLKLEALLFQASILRIFDAIANDMTIALKPEFSELRALADDVAGRVVEMFEKNASALAVQMLFPKTKYEANLIMRAKMIIEEEAETFTGAEAQETDPLDLRGAAVNPEAPSTATKKSRRVEAEPEPSRNDGAQDEEDGWDLGGMIENEREAALVRLQRQREAQEEKRRVALAEEEAKRKQAAASTIMRQRGSDESEESSLEFEEVLQELEEEIEAEEEALANWTEEQDEELKSTFELYSSLDDPDINLWEAVSTSVGSASSWQCYRRLQQLGVSLPLAVAPPEMERRVVKKKQKVTRKVAVPKKKDKSQKPEKQPPAESGAAPEEAPVAEKAVSKKKKELQPKKPRKKRAVPKELEGFIIDDYDDGGAAAAAAKEKEAKKKKNKKKRGRQESDEEEEVVSHMSDEEDQEETESKKKGKKQKKQGHKRRKTSDGPDEDNAGADADAGENLREQLRMGAFEKDNEEAEDEDMSVRFVPRRGRLVRQRAASEPQDETSDVMDLDIDDDDVAPSAPATSGTPQKAVGRRRALLDDDDDAQASATPPAPSPAKKLQLQYESQPSQDLMEVDIPEEDQVSAPPSTQQLQTQKSQSAKGRRVIDDDDE